MKLPPFVFGVVAALGLLLAGCDYDGPLTAQATHPIDRRLLGDWETKDNDRTFRLLVRAWDDTQYVLVGDTDVYRAFHSDFAGQPFVSVQSLDLGTHTGTGFAPKEGKFAFVAWRLSADGSELGIRLVDLDVPAGQPSDTRTMQRLVKEKMNDPKFLAKEQVYHRAAPRHL